MAEVNNLQLWNHQKEAIKKILDYVNSRSTKAFMVKMPTGTGKTGIFSVLSRITLKDLNFLIVTPSTALKFQIINELRSKFWKKINIDSQKLLDKKINPILPNTAITQMETFKKNKFIGVTTIQTLQTLFANNKTQYDDLRQLVDIIIFDEGHKEPAYSWSEAVRSMNKPTILFTATPYRNDLKIFNIDKSNYFYLSHNQAVKNHTLRMLELKKLPYSQTKNVSQFCIALVKEFETQKKDFIATGISNPKVIIRCSNKFSIQAITRVLSSMKKKVVGIHEELSGENLTTSVPSFEDQKKYEYYVHQYKLVEGIDNPDFCMLAIFEDFSNTRSLLQQIGRILRNVSNSPIQKGIVVSHNITDINRQWERYLEYDELTKNKSKLFDISDVLTTNKEVNTLYFDGTFRDLIDLDNLELKKTLLFPLKANLLFPHTPVNAVELAQKIIEELEKKDYEILKQEFPNKNCFLILYVIYSNSPIIDESLFIEQKLAFTYFQITANLVYFYDSEGNYPFTLKDNVAPVSLDVLIKLLLNKTRIIKTNLQNGDIGNASYRNREISSQSLETTAATLSDHMYFPSTFTAYINSDFANGSQRRYLGLKKGRVSDFTSKRFKLSDFGKWIDEIEKLVNSNQGLFRLEYFLSRYATKESNPSITTPACILLDIDDEILEHYRFGQNLEPVIYNDFYSEIANDKFKVKINNAIFDVDITYDTSKKKYLIKSTDLDNNLIPADDSYPSLTAYFNALQSFRIMIDQNKYIYSYGNFLIPSLNLSKKQKVFDLLSLFHSYPEIRNIKSEKGDLNLLANGTTWNQNTLFGLIQRQGKGYNNPMLEKEFGFEYIVCDDLQNPELADFIAINKTLKRIAFIHAKAGDSSLSASAFHEVCGQATKNLDYLNPFYSKEPVSNISKWGRKWNLAPIGSANRITGITPKSFWTAYRQLMSLPDTSREVWLVMGNSFDFQKFKTEISKTEISKVSPQVFQIAYLLRSTWGSAQSIGAKLKILC